MGGGGRKIRGQESPGECVIRETLEETGLLLTSFEYKGIVTFVSDKWETEYMHLFTATEYEGKIKECDEGKLEWVPKSQIEQLNLWEGDKIFFRLLEEKAGFFSLKLCYDKDVLIFHEIYRY